MRYRLNEAQRWVLAALGMWIVRHERTFEQVGGLERPAWSSKSAEQLRETWRILTADDARRMLAQLMDASADPARSPLLLGFDRTRALGVASWAFHAYLLELDEAWAVMFAAARELQGAFGSWQEFAQSYIFGHASSGGDWRELQRLQAIADHLLRDRASPWTTLPWTTPLADARRAPPVEQTVRTVDAAGHGDFVTIADALRAAAWGDRLRVMAGVYRERIWIETPVELEGVGEVLIENALGCCLMVKRSAAVVRNLRFRSGTSPSGEAMHAVIAHGQFLKLIDCDVASARIGVHVASAAAHVILENTQVHDTASAGVLVHEGVLVMDGGAVRGSAMGNVQLEGPTEARLTRVTLEGAGQSGLAVTQGAEALVIDSVLANNLAGVDAMVAGQARLIGCRIAGNRAGGGRAFGANSTLFIEGGRLDSNGAVNVGADHGANVEVTGCEVRGAGCAGWADHAAKIRFTRCRIGLGEEGLLREMNGGSVELIDTQAAVQPLA